MYLDADQLPDGSTLAGFDLCIVGAGAAGIALAQQLIGSQLKVLVVTSGLRTDSGEPPPDTPRQQFYQGSIGPFLQEVNPGFLTSTRLNAYGGTTNHFAFYAHPLAAEDLLPRPGYRTAHWPIGIEELNRYYPGANAFGNYGPFNYDNLAFWAQALGGEPLSSLSEDQLLNVIWHAQYNASIHQFQTHYGTLLQAARNVTVLFNATVLQIETTPGQQQVTGLRCATLAQQQPGIHFGVAARRYVLAQGGVETVRLLKLSNNLGDNAKQHLGRGFMLHPLIQNAAEVTVPTAIFSNAGRFYQQQQVTLRPQPALAGDQAYQPAAALPYHPGELADWLQLTAWGLLAPTPAALAYNQIGSFHTNLSFMWAPSAKTTTLTLSMNWESAPNEDSTVTLDLTKRDPIFDQPVVRVDWRLLESDKRTIQCGLALLEQYFAVRGGQDFKVLTDLSGGPDHWTFDPEGNDPARLQTGDHHMGTLRMAATPADGIVDANLKVHTVENLYVVGSGVFPTSGHANPTLTIVALALRLADHLKAQA